MIIFGECVLKNSSDDVNVFVVLIVVLVGVISIFAMLFFSSVNRFSSDFVGFASYPGYAVPVSSIVVDNNLVFSGVSDSLSRFFTVSDAVVYRLGYVSYDGQSWVPFNLTPSGSVSGDWFYSSALANVLFTPSILRLNVTHNSANNTYVLVYSCSKNTTLKAWDCHGGWQILQFNAQLNTVSLIAPTITFISPTPSSGSTINASSQQIVATVTDDSSAISSWIDFDKSLVGYWSMDYYSSTGIYDNSTYKNFGTFNGGLSTSNIVTGVRGKALSFDGMSNGLNMGDILDLGVSDYSYSMWIKANDNRRSFILTKGAVAGYNGVRIETDSTFYGVAIFGYAADYDLIRGPAISLNDEQWHHIVVTFDRSGYGIWYTDGVAGTPVDISAGNNQNIDVTDNLLIGTATNAPFNGSIDEIMIFNRVLSPSEVKALYDSKVNRFDAAFNGLVNSQHMYTIYAIDGLGNLASSSRNFVVNAASSCTPSCSGKQCGSDGCSGTCGTCSNSHGTTSCSSSGLCQPTCTSGYANCDSNNVNGCETQLGTTSNCASCGNACSTGQTCTNNVCISSTTTCTDTCSSLGYICGTQTICGKSVNCGTCSSTGTTYYISTSGSDSNSGTSISTAWKTLAHACSSVTASGSIIHVTAGTYIETNECQLAVGVSIEGEGTTSIIKSHYTTTRSSAGINGAAIFLSSLNEGTNGNQHISNIKLDGDKLQGSGGILVLRRSNVTIHDCTIVDFFMNGITVSGTTNDYSEPSIYATGNQLYNNIIINCGDTDTTWNGGGLIEIGGQEGMLIHDNILNETGRAQGHNGDILCGGFYNKGVKYYRNKSYKPDYDGDAWNFHLEIWYYHGGYEIYDNEFYGGDTEIDICGQADRTDDYAYSFYIHDNLFTGHPIQTENGKVAIAIEEAYNKDEWIYRNHFLNIPTVLEIKGSNNGPAVNKQIYFAYNILEKSGWNDDTKYENIFEFYSSGSDIMSDIYIYNNVILGDDVTHTTAMKIENLGTVSNFNIINNVIENNDNGEFLNVANSGKIDGLHVNNNVLYNNVNNNNPVFSGNTVNDYQFVNNLKVDPLFVDATNGNFHLKPNSPAIDKGINVGLTSDYEGNPVPYGNAPDIGAYECHP